MTATPMYRQFAPLKEDAASDSGVPPLKGVIFDMDGTLWSVTLPLWRCVLLYFLHAIAPWADDYMYGCLDTGVPPLDEAYNELRKTCMASARDDRVTYEFIFRVNRYT